MEQLKKQLIAVGYTAEELKGKTITELKALLAEFDTPTKKESKGNSEFDLRTAFIQKIPQGLKDRKSFILDVVLFEVKQSNVENLIEWLRKNDKKSKADEVEANASKFFDIHILCEDGTQEIFNSGILAYDKKKTLSELVVETENGFDYFVNSITWDALNKELRFA